MLDVDDFTAIVVDAISVCLIQATSIVRASSLPKCSTPAHFRRVGNVPALKENTADATPPHIKSLMHALHIGANAAYSVHKPPAVIL